jgi:hypothetical protein
MENPFGVDVAYFKKELESLLSTLNNRTPDELSRYLNCLADVASPVKSNTLLPCPFCNSSAKLEDHRTIWVVKCSNSSCDATVLGERAPEPEGKMPPGYWEKFEQSAIDRWNKRPNFKNVTLSSTPEIITEVPDGCKRCGFHPLNYPQKKDG